ncbi:MAG: NnrS family protein, partial [Campylobacterales bacterium]|nr:NnrS family protein [Campylobacterales bacterium]
GSRVAMGHSGRKIVADKKTTVIFISIIFLSIIRALGVFDAYLLNISIYVWCIVFTIWLYFYAPMLLSE